uniref:Uncharacterized protein DP238L n=2 Tax=African swine fever virus TaxID=10497 RepID=VFD38_ASFP4|nr:RecName: Full=Uncharacterized protein DP238L [African swine fever virus tick/South Africa/Pretoriuskop Pr4/1996]
MAHGRNIRKRTFSDMDTLSDKNIGIHTNSLPKNLLCRRILFKGKISKYSIFNDSLAKDHSSNRSMSIDGLIGKKRPHDISFQNMNSSMPSSTQKKTRILDEEIKDQSSSNENDRDSPVIVTLKPSYMPKTSRITEIIHKMKELNMNRIEDGLSFNKKRSEHDAKNVLLHTMEMEEDCEIEEDIAIDSPYLNTSLSEDDTESIVETDYSEEEKESISETESSSDDESYSLYDSF